MSTNNILDSLSDLIEGLTETPTNEQLYMIYGRYLDDIAHSPIVVNGQSTLVNKNKVNSSQKYDRFLLGKHETFCHIVTRGKGKRQFDANRANKIHWIKPILENSEDKRIKYFEGLNNENQWCQFYWYKSRSYIVILKEITNGLFLVTGYCVDPSETKRFNNQWQAYELQQKIEAKKNLPRR